MTADKFFEECKKNGITLIPNEQAKVRGLLRPGSGKLSKDMGAAFEKASFYELACQIGDEVNGISEWLDRTQQEREDKEKARRLEETKLAEKAAKTEEAERKEVPAKAEETEPKKAPEETAKAPVEEYPKKEAAEAQPKKVRKSQADFDYSSFFGQTSLTDSESAKETKRKIASLKREKDYLNRNIAMYKRDFATLSAINKYGKYSGNTVSAAGLDASGNMAQVIHAAVSLLVGEIKASGDELLLKKITEAQEEVTRDVEEIERKIEELEKKLR